MLEVDAQAQTTEILKFTCQNEAIHIPCSLERKTATLFWDFHNEFRHRGLTGFSFQFVKYFSMYLWYNDIECHRLISAIAFLASATKRSD